MLLIENWKKNYNKEIEEQTLNLVYTISFSVHFMEKLVKNNESLKKLMVKFMLFFNNVNANLSFGMLNLNYENDLNEIFNFNENCIENLLLINSTFHQMLNYFKSSRLNYNDNNLKEITLKKIDNILNLYKEFYAKLEMEEKMENLGSVEDVMNYYKNQLK